MPSDAASFKTTDRMVEEVGVVGMYAAGSYVCKCVSCEELFIGDKRARQCLPCALKSDREGLIDRALTWANGQAEPEDVGLWEYMTGGKK